MTSKFLRTLVLLALTVGFHTSLSAADRGGVVNYYPVTRLVEGDQPLVDSYVLQIISPSNTLVGQNTSITPVLSVVYAPSGVSDAVALSHVTMNPSTLVFTGPNQTLTTTVTSNFPLGTNAGNYAFRIATPGWPTGTIDGFAFINAKVTIPPVALEPPLVSLLTPLDGATYTYSIGGPPVAVTVSFRASASLNAPITSLDADISGIAVALTTVTGLGTATATGQGTLLISQPGVYTVQVRAANDIGTSTNSAEITIGVVAPPPTVAIAAPVLNSSYTYTGGAALLVPYSFSAVSAFGGITNFTATLNGNPITLSPIGLNTLNASATGNLQIQAGGSFTLVVTATDQNGTASSTRTFNVTTPVPPPTITIAQPLHGSVITRVAGSPATLVPFNFTALASAGFTISAISATLNGNAIAVASNGLGTATTTGTGNLSLSAPGTYTLIAEGNSGAVSATATTTFTVVETIPVPPPTITITQPVHGSVITRVAGSPATLVPFNFTALAGSGFTISTVSATFNGNPVTFTPSGIGTGTASGAGNLSVSAPGTYTFVATGSSGASTASAAVTFTVTETQPPVDTCNILWLPPISLGKVVKGGSEMPIKFNLVCCTQPGGCQNSNHQYNGNGNGHTNSNGNGHRKDDDDDDNDGPGNGDHENCPASRDTSVVIAIYEIFPNGSSSPATLYPYGTGSPNPPNYTINGNKMYHLNFNTAKGKHRYHIDVYRFPAGSSTPQLVGTKEFTTR
ncbi:MAG: hypothetical protein Q8J74_09565 [Candidatus Didemnitutus sp.]|nr:hypothetical protein [Candidatus Didemnitutus sp.]